MIDKTVMVTIVGRPNVGKSTLVNALVGEKISIVTPKPQTTRNRIFGVALRGGTQLVLVDTPGFHRARTKLGDYMVKVVRDSVDDVDAVCLVVEAKANVGHQEEALIERIKQSGAPAVLAVNKIDTVKKEKLLPVIALYSEKHDFEAVVPVSARTGSGIGELFDELEKFAKEGQQLFPEDMITDQPERQMCAEIIREKLLLNLQSEVPHGVAVEISSFKVRDDGITEISATIYCEKESHKGIIIGKNGDMLKKVGEQASIDMEKLLDGKVFLSLWAKVKPGWRDSGANLRTFGYSDEN